ncbi:hypothetical protein [Nonomuraea angiospora]|uniref:hypothetical protein n=1 Tax=Nonomuraea angiospora TaxID=46172 RepID=UPI0029B4BBD7|nr:hypothetical protein [Nonomuraea angiospora]MDX3100432.1 hypothetical protein [Nonomuraea angiospora]
MRVNWTIREPLLLRGAIALLLMGAVRLCIALGVIPPEWALDEARVEQLLDGAVVAWAWFSGRHTVTPVAAPRDREGLPLVQLTKRPHQ